MKLIQSALAPLFTIALMLVAGTADAANSKPRQPLEQICSSQFASCMFNGRPAPTCSLQRENCMRGGSVLGPLIGSTQDASSSLPTLSPDAERDIGRFKQQLAMNDASPRTRQLGDTYCLKMLRACDAGNQSACDRFERYCAP